MPHTFDRKLPFVEMGEFVSKVAVLEVALAAIQGVNDGQTLGD